jgi:hypothetical protein
VLATRDREAGHRVGACDRSARPGSRAHDGFGHLFAAKYGWEYRVAMLVEQTIRRFRPMVGPDRRIVRITEG